MIASLFAKAAVIVAVIPALTASLPTLLMGAPAPIHSATSSSKHLNIKGHNTALKIEQGLKSIRQQISSIEEQLASDLDERQSVQQQIQLINRLLSLQRKERQLSQERLALIEQTIKELENRSATLKEKITRQQKALRLILSLLDSHSNEQNRIGSWIKDEIQWIPIEIFLQNTVDIASKDLEAYRIDFEDAQYLQEQILNEQQTLSYMVKDLEEQEEVLKLNKKIQTDFLTKRKSIAMESFKSYRRLKQHETRINTMLSEFNARNELKSLETKQRMESRESEGLINSEFARLKGQLPMPVQGLLVTQFGQSYDPASGIKVFKKGLEIRPVAPEVHSVGSGRVAFSGEMPELGKVVVIDHGGHYYTLSARLVESIVKTGDIVSRGQPLGKVHLAGDPFYFEIRAKNLPVNPMHWLSAQSGPKL